jgi:hypothetical protein
MSEITEKVNVVFSSDIFYLLKVEKNDEVANPDNGRSRRVNFLLDISLEGMKTINT